jgi:hypothetical protein
MCTATESIVAARILPAHTGRVAIEEYPDLVGLGFLSMRRKKCGHDKPYSGMSGLRREHAGAADVRIG